MGRPAPDDWRRAGQESELQPGTALVLTPYKARSPTWEHEHCLFCFAKFMDPSFSEAHRRLVAEDPEILTEGYTTTDEHEQGAEWHWVCPQCAGDFGEELGLRLEPAPGG